MSTHTYRTTHTWTGSTPSYQGYSREHRVEIGPLGASVSADPAYGGDPALPNPEHLLVAAAGSCQMLSFLAICGSSGVDVVEYRDEAEAEMPDEVRPVRITRITLRPHVVVRTETSSAPVLDEAKVRRLMEKAHRECFIANSLTSEIGLEPTVAWV